MVLKAEQERLQALLKDTITLLCKNGLAYSSEFCVEALIGITLDKENVMLVSINETVKSAVASGLEDDTSFSSSGAHDGGDTADGHTSPRSRHYGQGGRQSLGGARRKRRYPAGNGNNKVKVELPPTHHVGEEGEDAEEDYDDPTGGGGDDDGEESQSPAPSRRRVETKQENSDAEDIIVIKEELDPDSWDCQYQAGGGTRHDGHGSGPAGGGGDGANQLYSQGDTDLSQVLQSGSLEAFSPVGHRTGGGGHWHEDSLTGVPGSDKRLLSSMMSSIQHGGGSLDQQVINGAAGATSEPYLPPYRTSSEKPFACDSCGSSYATRHGLREHIRRHNGEFRYRCTECDRGFLIKTHFEAHMYRHRNLTPFSCGLCGRGFSFQYLARQHELKCTHDTSAASSRQDDRRRGPGRPPLALRVRNSGSQDAGVGGEPLGVPSPVGGSPLGVPSSIGGGSQGVPSSAVSGPQGVPSLSVRGGPQGAPATGVGGGSQGVPFAVGGGPQGFPP